MNAGKEEGKEETIHFDINPVLKIQTYCLAMKVLLCSVNMLGFAVLKS
jgi:hypothetical protein